MFAFFRKLKGLKILWNGLAASALSKTYRESLLGELYNPALERHSGHYVARTALEFRFARKFAVLIIALDVNHGVCVQVSRPFLQLQQCRQKHPFASLFV